jgi:hypothetical protein
MSHDRLTDIPIPREQQPQQDQSRERIPDLQLINHPEFTAQTMSHDSFPSHDQYTPDEFRNMLPSSDDVFTIDIDQSLPEPPYQQTSYLPRDDRPDQDLRSPYPDIPRSPDQMNNVPYSYHDDLCRPSILDHSNPDTELAGISAKAHEKQVARILPSPQKVDDNGSDSSGRPMEYTRDQLYGTIERIRNSQRARRTRPVSSDSALDAILRRPSRSPSTVRRPSLSNVLPDRGSVYATNIAPYKDFPNSRLSITSVSSGLGSGAGSRHVSVGMYPSASGPDGLYPGVDMRDTSHSSTSGIGSRNTSNSTGSVMPPGDNSQQPLSSLLNPPEAVSDDSSLYSIAPPPLCRDASVDENYEFDTENGLESDILDIIRQYHRPRQLSFDADRGLSSQVQPFSPEEHCNRLREEFREYRRRQVSGEIDAESCL